jgi:broad specificity phosphatase PhoE
VGTVVVIRHAQGSLFSDDYDRLSDVGRRQAKALGEHWAGQGRRFDRIYSGPAVRHRDTEALAREGIRAAGIEWPQVEIVEDLDEHDAAGLMRGVIPSLSELRPDLVPLLERALGRIEDRGERQRVWEELFVKVIAMWIRGEADPEGIETWPEFTARVRRGLDHVLADGEERDVAVFTSIGPSAVTLARALGATDQAAYDAAWRLLNCSVTRYAFSDGRLILEGLNAGPHLDPELLTTR